MDMDMEEMDIPLPEELEFLESNSHLYDDYPDLEPPESYPDEEQEEEPQPQPQPQPQQPTPLTDPPLISETQINGHKRSRSNGPDASTPETAGLSDEKRSRIDDLEPEQESEEDWLRYSPPPQETNHVVEEPEEKILSRYASQIDGDCIPVTAPSGDRVYAKMCRVEREERLNKMHMKVQSGGRISFALILFGFQESCTLYL
jgi:chromosome transmission fidelity protein 18